MIKNTFNHTLFLSLSSHIEQTLTRITVIIFDFLLHPVGCNILHIVLIKILVKEITGTSVYCHVYDTHTNFFW